MTSVEWVSWSPETELPPAQPLSFRASSQRLAVVRNGHEAEFTTMLQTEIRSSFPVPSEMIEAAQQRM
jgi:hypothetical protein